MTLSGFSPSSSRAVSASDTQNSLREFRCQTPKLLVIPSRSEGSGRRVRLSPSRLTLRDRLSLDVEFVDRIAESAEGLADLRGVADDHNQGAIGIDVLP